MTDYFRRNLTYDEAPKGSKHEDWHCGETEDYIMAAIGRVREATMTTHDTPGIGPEATDAMAGSLEVEDE